jgi:hypothetical protein
VPAPIALFVYKRPEHTLRTLESLHSNLLADKSELHIFADGVRDLANEKEKTAVEKVRQIIRLKHWTKDVFITEYSHNQGLAKNITQGVSQLVARYGRVIVLEDDLVLSPYFLTFMNQALDYYASHDKVMHISGYCPPLALHLPPTFFYTVPSPWGWATWARAWAKYNPDVEELWLRLQTSQRIKEFDWTKIFLPQLNKNLQGEMNTWAIRWYASVFLEEGLCLVPNISLVNNIGFDDSGEHCKSDSSHFVPQLADNIEIREIPLEENRIFRKKMRQFYRFGGIGWRRRWNHYMQYCKGVVFRTHPDLFRRLKTILKPKG